MDQMCHIVSFVGDDLTDADTTVCTMQYYSVHVCVV